ncbi:MAG TPA: FAD-dependent oxidoreductase, partial [Candidatus Acidoferrum sp.]|nr:FAD-dependent oxidoreductase [Candidatus Acidoferrum sp.]
MKTYDVAVIGAGVFGAWTTLHLARRGKRVILLEAYGPGHSRSSSGDESRIIRMGYGKDEIYTRWSQQSLVQWKELFAACGQKLFHETGVLWLAGGDETRLIETRATLKQCGVPFEDLDLAGLQEKYPQIGLDGIRNAILEPQSGVLLARRAVAATVAEAVRLEVTYQLALVEAPITKGALYSIKTNKGE